MRIAAGLLALLFAVACGDAPNPDAPPRVNSAAVLDTFVGLYGECFAAPGFPQVNEAALREAAFVQTARVTSDGWVPVVVPLQNSSTGQTSEPTFRINVAENLGNPESGNADAQAVLAKCP